MMCGLLLSLDAGALDLAGVHLADTAQVGNATLQLNGGGIRTRWFFKVYVGALYLPARQSDANAIIGADGPYRISLTMLRGLGEKRFLDAFIEAIAANHSKEEMAALDPQIKQMIAIFHKVGEVKTGDLIALDYQPVTGTQISVNGRAYGAIPGEMFRRALLKIWLGSKPVQDDLKKDMLGG